MSKHTYNFFQTSLVRSRIAERCRIFLTAGKHIFPPYQENFIIFLFIYLFVCLFIYLFFRAAPMAYGGSQARGWLRAAAANLYHSHSNMGSELHLWHIPQLTAMPDPLIHWARSGIQPTYSWILVRFVTTDSQWELLTFLFKLRYNWPITLYYFQIKIWFYICIYYEMITTISLVNIHPHT